MAYKPTYWIYTIRTKHDMAVIYVGCTCSRLPDRVAQYRKKNTPIGKKIRELESQGIELITCIEEECPPTKNYLETGFCKEQFYIDGYARLRGKELMNVASNRHRQKRNVVCLTKVS